MPAYVVPFKCDGCGECIRACPQSILHIDSKTRKAFNIETDMCWECLPCMKACPQHAIEVRSYSDFAPIGGRVTCDRDTKANFITWNIRYRDGRELVFKYPIRTTEWGTIKPPALLPEPGSAQLKSPLLFGEPEIFGLKELPVPGKSLARL